MLSASAIYNAIDLFSRPNDTTQSLVHLKCVFNSWVSEPSKQKCDGFSMQCNRSEITLSHADLIAHLLVEPHFKSVYSVLGINQTELNNLLSGRIK